MFGSHEIHSLVKAIDFLHHTTFDLHDGRACPDTSMMAMENDAEPNWGGLSKQQRVEVLNRYVDWTEFQPEQVDKIIDNIASGKERRQWFDNVPMGHVAEHHYKEWLAFEKLPEEEQLRVAARCMRWQSMTLGGKGVMVHAEWEEMDDWQRHHVIFNQLDTSYGSDMLSGRWEDILKAELGYWPGEGAITPDGKPLPSPSQIIDNPKEYLPESSYGDGYGHDKGKDRGR